MRAEQSKGIRGYAVRGAAAVVGVLLAASATAALADDASFEDPRDETQKVDPVEVSHGHHASLGDVLVHEIRMAKRWNDDELLGISIEVWLPDGDRPSDREVGVGFNPDGSLNAIVFDAKGRTRGYANAWMADDLTVRVDLPKRLLRRGVQSYRWRASVGFECSAPEGAECVPQVDRVPDKGRITHRL